MTPLEQHLYNIGTWVSTKFNLHIKATAKDKTVITQGEIWRCNLGYNIGQEKNKERPVLVISNNRVNRTGKVIVVCITDAVNKMNSSEKPQQNTWFLLYSDTLDNHKMYRPGRTVPRSAIKYSILSKDSIVQCEEIRSISKVRLSQKIGNVDPSDFDLIKIKLKNVFDIR